MRGEEGAKAAEVEEAGVELRFTIGAQALQDGREAVAELAEAEKEGVQADDTRTEEKKPGMRGEEGYPAIVCQRLLSWEEARANAAEAAKADVVREEATTPTSEEGAVK